MMVINSGDQLPESLAVAALRWAWRYRSELAPAYPAALLLAPAGGCTPPTGTRGRILAALAAVAACAAGHRRREEPGCPPSIERLYAATLTLAAGAWLAAAAISARSRRRCRKP